jgi:hypothetical protein
MLGLMQDWPLLCHRIIKHAARVHGEQEELIEKLKIVGWSTKSCKWRRGSQSIRFERQSIFDLLDQNPPLELRPE